MKVIFSFVCLYFEEILTKKISFLKPPTQLQHRHYIHTYSIAACYKKIYNTIQWKIRHMLTFNTQLDLCRQWAFFDSIKSVISIQEEK